MRAIVLLASVLALSVVQVACTQETTPTASNKPAKKGKTSKPGKDNENGEHGSNAPADTDDDEVPGGDALTSGTWETGKALTTSTINAGETITIAPGAVVTAGADVALTIKGTLKVASSATHAKITGTAWRGIIIAEGGKLEADGLEIIGAKTGIATEPGNGPSTFENGVLEAETAFKMQAGSNLTVDHSKITSSAGSAIAGTFLANYMEYDKKGGGGLTLNDPDGTMTINNSKLTGSGGGDYVISNAGKKVTVTRSAISGSHCALHFSGAGDTPSSGVAAFTIDGVDIRNNGVGGMLYTSGAGPNEVKNTNFTANNEYDIGYGSNKNGNITFTNTYGTIPDAANITQTAKATDLLPPAQVGPVAE